MQKGNIKKAILALLVALTVLFSLIFSQAGSIYEYEDSFPRYAHPEQMPKVDVIVCLAGARGRIAAASDVWYQYFEKMRSFAPTLYLSGVGPKADWGTLRSQVRSEILQSMSPDSVVMENVSENTVENAHLFSENASRRGWKKILLVTSSYHMRRAQFLFENVLGKDSVITTYTVTYPPFTQQDWKSEFLSIRITMSEYIKWWFYRTFPGLI